MTEIEDLRSYLQTGREALLWKVEGVSEYDARRPLTPTATSLLGIVKHVASVESEYFGANFGRPFPEPLPWFGPDAEPEADMWLTADESRDDLLALYRRVWAHSDETMRVLGPDAVGTVPWWPPERRTVTLHRIAVHMIAETHRHAGHMDILREQLDGAIGYRADNDNLGLPDIAARHTHHERVEAAARTFR